MQSLEIRQQPETYEPGLYDPKTDEQYCLWMVVYTYSDGRINPFTSIVYVLAQNEKQAIQQGEDVAVGPFRPSAVEGSMAFEDGRLTATATRVPFLVRGWGRSTF